MEKNPIKKKSVLFELQRILDVSTQGVIVINIRIYQLENKRFTIHPDEEITSEIASLLHNHQSCRITEMITRAGGHSVGLGFDLGNRRMKYSGLIAGYMIDDSLTAKDIAELLAKHFNAKLSVAKEDHKYMINDEHESYA